MALLLGLAVVVACSNRRPEAARPPPAPLAPDLKARLSTWLDAEGQEPEAYVVGLFTDHDVVFVGEWHRIRHDPVFVQSLLEPLHRAGVRVLATEFARRQDQADIDTLVNGPVWDEELARRIVLQHFVPWGYREYVDLFRAAWLLNRRLPPGAERFRVLGLNDSPDWSLIETEADRDDPDIRERVWRGGGEQHWARVILDAVQAGDKVLVYSGMHHAFTEYRQPVVIDGAFERFGRGLRCGNHVYEAIGKRAVTVFLHSPWAGYEGYESRTRYPADGIIDALMLDIGPRPVGFDVSRGPFAELAVKDAVYRHGYPEFRLAKYCDGWIYTKPFAHYEGVTPIEGWIHAGNLDYARAQLPRPAFRQAPIERFNEAIAQSADMPHRMRHLR